MRIFKLWSDNKTQRRSAFRSNRCSRWLKAYDRGSTVVYKFFAYRWFQSWEMFLIFRFSWSILWSFAVTVFSGLYSDNDGDERPMLSLLSRGSLLWMNLGGTSFQFPSAAKESFWFCFDIFFEKSVHKRVQRRIGQEEHFSCHCFIIGLIAEIKIKAYRQMDVCSVKRHTYDNKHSYHI